LVAVSRRTLACMDNGVVLFDLDGVLVDSRGPISSCINQALAAHGLPERDPADLYRYIGPPLLQAFADLAGEPVTSDVVDRCATTYREHYAQASLTETEVTPGIADALLALRGEGRTLGVATSKPRPFAEPLLEVLGLREHFAVVAGPELDATGEDKTTTVGAALRALGAGGGAGAMVGDRSFDMVAARAHGLRAVGVGWGIGSRAELEAAGAQRIVAAPAELPAAVGL
jgi:phosphoglycolate phosphatase